MSEEQKQAKRLKRKQTVQLILGNAVRFAFNILFISVFQALFGAVNVLPGVAIVVALTMYPTCNLGMKPGVMAAVISILFVLSGFVAQLALLSPWIALPVNFLFTILILALSGEPLSYRTSICFLLSFVFCQATPVPAEQFPTRLLALVCGAALVAGTTVLLWKKNGYGKNGRTGKEQILLCLSPKNRSYILRMAAGLSAAMLIGSLLGLQKPLWISIVVMSLTQPEFQQTMERVKYRSLGTIAGIVGFVVVFRLLLPQEYSTYMVMLLGYLNFFTSEYKYQTVVNAVSALNASMVLLEPSIAVIHRVLCLLGGIAIVLFLYLAEKAAPKIRNGVQWLSGTIRRRFLSSRIELTESK